MYHISLIYIMLYFPLYSNKLFVYVNVPLIFDCRPCGRRIVFTHLFLFISFSFFLFLYFFSIFSFQTPLSYAMNHLYLIVKSMKGICSVFHFYDFLFEEIILFWNVIYLPVTCGWGSFQRHWYMLISLFSFSFFSVLIFEQIARLRKCTTSFWLYAMWKPDCILSWKLEKYNGHTHFSL